MKRKATLLMAAVMAASSLPMTAYAANFKDINDVPWAGAETIINRVADRGLLGGYEDNTFRARNNVTYCEAMQMVYTTLNKSGAVQPLDAVEIYSYMAALDTYRVPAWAQTAVAYGLATGILDIQMVITKFADGTQTATREDVAMIFGNAMRYVFGKEKDVTGATSFVDYWSISANALEQISMLKKLGILNGDEYNRFNPKKNINRTEMAVMLDKTYDVLTQGVNISGEINELNVNKGADGTNYYYVQIRTEAGHNEGFSVTDGKIPVYVGETSETVSMSSLSEGDDVVFMISGNNLIGIRLMSAVTKQETYDITGYINSVKDNTISLENENTGEDTRYKLESGVDCYVDGKKVKRSELEEILKEHRDEYAYAGVNTSVKREKVDGEYKNVTYVEEIYVTFTDAYSAIGEVKKLSETNIYVKLADSNAEKSFIYADDCEFYIGTEETDYDEMKEMVDDGTVYVKVMANAEGKAVSVTLAEDTFAEDKELEESRTYKVNNFTDKKMILEDSKEKITYEFGSKNPIDNIQFYTWDKNASSFDAVDFEEAENYVDNSDADTIYCKITFNKGGRLSEVSLSGVRSAWKNSDEHQTERKGTVVSVEDDILKFKTSAIEYKLLKSYADGDLKNNSGLTDSKTLLAKMANDDGLELYAELKANGDNEIIEIETRLKSAEGKLVEFNSEERYIEIKTADGNVFKLPSQRKPKLTDEIEDEFEIDDLDGETSVYIGEKVILGFASGGQVNEITVGNGVKQKESEVQKVKGIAVSAEDGLKLEGSNKTYRWFGKTSDISIKNYSGTNESFEMIKRMIEDPDVKVYVEATLEESEKGDSVVDGLKIYVREAEGTLRKFDGDVTIKTDSGNTFTFYAKTKLDTCDVNGYGREDLKEREKGIGEYVTLTFEDGGQVCGIEG